MRRYITAVVRFIDEDTGPSDIARKIDRALLDSEQLEDGLDVGELHTEVTVGGPVKVNENNFAVATSECWPLPVVDGRTITSKGYRDRN